MARRMFSDEIVRTDAFLTMPLSAQAVYFHLGMEADDDGFVKNPKSLIRMLGGQEDDLKLLIQKSFVLVFDSGVIVIKHWKKNNYIRRDRYRETDCYEEKRLLYIKKDNSYTFDKKQGVNLSGNEQKGVTIATDFQKKEHQDTTAETPVVYQRSTSGIPVDIPVVYPDKNRLDKTRVDKNRLSIYDSDNDNVYKLLFTATKKLLDLEIINASMVEEVDEIFKNSGLSDIVVSALVDEILKHSQGTILYPVNYFKKAFNKQVWIEDYKEKRPNAFIGETSQEEINEIIEQAKKHWFNFS